MVLEMGVNIDAIMKPPQSRGYGPGHVCLPHACTCMYMYVHAVCMFGRVCLLRWWGGFLIHNMQLYMHVHACCYMCIACVMVWLWHRATQFLWSSLLITCCHRTMLRNIDFFALCNSVRMLLFDVRAGKQAGYIIIHCVAFHFLHSQCFRVNKFSHPLAQCDTTTKPLSILLLCSTYVRDQNILTSPRGGRDTVIFSSTMSRGPPLH